MSKINLLCLGFGQVAKSFVKKILDDKKNLNLVVTTTQKTHLKNINNLNFESFEFNNKIFDNNIVKKIETSDYILVSIPPINGEDIVIKNFNKNLKKIKNCKWITYLSATSVYGDHSGKWVTEDSVTKPSSPNGVNRLNAENSWKNFSAKYNLPLQIFRLAGIYSNEYNILKRLKLGEVKVVNKKNHFFSRIHVEDIANILFKSMENFRKNEIYNICDDKPSTQQEVAIYGSKLLKIEQPKVIKLDDLESEMLKNFYKDSKKVSNIKMKNFFKFKLKYPTYIEGLNYIHNNFI